MNIPGTAPTEIAAPYRNGVLTPWAEVLCLTCYPIRHPSQPMPRGLQRLPATAMQPAEGQACTVCDQCGAPIVLDEIPAMENELVSIMRAERLQARMFAEDGISGAKVALPFHGHLMVYADCTGSYYVAEHDMWGLWIPRLDRTVDGQAAVLNLIRTIYHSKLRRMELDAR